MFDLGFLNDLREREMERLMPLIPDGARVLEFGAGTGMQARYLADRGYDVIAIDLPQSQYAPDRVFPVQDYDGRHIPVPSGSIDVIFSSNVMEHVEDVPTTLAEFKRVLKPDGFAVHAMPTPSWRLWTFATAIPTAVEAGLLAFVDFIRPTAGASRLGAFSRRIRQGIAAVLPRGHGTSREGFSELWTFSAPAWRRKFGRHAMKVIEERPIGLFYTGHMLLGRRLSFPARQRLSRALGSSGRIYVVR